MKGLLGCDVAKRRKGEVDVERELLPEFAGASGRLSGGPALSGARGGGADSLTGLWVEPAGPFPTTSL